MNNGTMFSMQRKIVLIRYWILAATVLISARLVHLQILLRQELRHKSERNFLRWQNTQPLRGDIVDRNGILLATNRPVVDVFWQPTSKRMSKEQIITLLTELETILERSLAHDELLLKTIVWAERTGKAIRIATDIPFIQLVKLKELYADHATITTTHRFTRYYPHAISACHLLGYLSTVDPERSGKMGLEKLLNNILKGQEGQTLTTINAVGKSIHQVPVRETQPGLTVHATLDIELQTLAEEVFSQELSGSFIIMDPSNGALRVLLSRPAFDPSMFLGSITHQQWNALQERRPFINRALEAAYPPGSIFKLVTISAALENGFINHDSSWYCCGYSTFCDRRYWCNKREGHGKMSVMQAIAHSCNPLFFELGKRMDIDLIASYAHTFGLGEPTGIALQERTGLIPTRAWKRKVKGESWWQGETLSAAIGQSFICVTPLQIARMVGSIFTGYLVKPRILEQETIVKTPLTLETSTLELLRASMRSAITTGTGRQVSRIKDMEIYAKTSTAQTSALERREEGVRYREHGWFVCHVQYKDTDPLVMVVLLENIGSSRAATSLAKDFLLKYKKYIDDQRSADQLLGLRIDEGI